ncbi:phosphodiesterase [Gammaproteobacteria bacterium AB-CW1]|uniref:Phosphodiesterase n=1 Tax=Natronospira elongata TaxID=3110268 RepID=A0AAP6JDH5_9GAMM|nr:phosphodiesterase [Gammaproteobacteria bacterium AB-CW1]
MDKILQITDTHLFADGDGELRGTRTGETLRKVLNHVQDHHADAKAILVTGDLVQQETEAAYRHFIQYFGDFQVPVLCIPGNHDDPDIMRRTLTMPPFRLDTRVSLGAWDVIQLDSHIPGSPAGRVGESGLAELDRLLKANRPRPTLVAVHHQPRPVGTPWLDGVGLKDGDQLLEIVSAHEHARAVIWGHVHQPSEGYHGHLRLLGTPSTCAQFLAGSEDFAIDPDAPPAYRVLYLDDAGRIDDELVQLQAADLPS